jgi:hypothetical protein
VTTKQTKLSKPVVDEDDDLDADGIEADTDDPDEDQKTISTKLVSNFIRMWPRAIFYTPADDGRKGTIASRIEELKNPGVYVLYRDDIPFYVGKTERKLRSRLRTHAIGVGSLKSYHWNFFSAFIVNDPKHIDEVEAILISAMPSVVMNSATPKIKRVKMDLPTRRLMHELHKKGQY